MDRIIFDNIAAGFPADDNFMRLVDGYRETITQLCKSVFGEEPVILSGLEIEKSGSGSEVTTTVSSGWIWLNNNILKSEKKVFLGDINVDNIVISSFQRITEGIYHNGESHPTYIANVFALKILNEHTPYFPGWVNLNKIRRCGQAKSIDIINMPIATGDLYASIQRGVVNISGVATFISHRTTDKKVVLGSIANTGIPTGGKNMLFPCVTTINPVKDKKEMVIAVLEKSSEGELSLFRQAEHLPTGKNELGVLVTAHINITYNI